MTKLSVRKLPETNVAQKQIAIFLDKAEYNLLCEHAEIRSKEDPAFRLSGKKLTPAQFARMIVMTELLELETNRKDPMDDLAESEMAVHDNQKRFQIFHEEDGHE